MTVPASVAAAVQEPPRSIGARALNVDGIKVENLGARTAGLGMTMYGYTTVRINDRIPATEVATVARHILTAHASEPELMHCDLNCPQAREWLSATAWR